MEDLYKAVGQFLMYKLALAKSHPGKILYLAIPLTAWNTIVADEIAVYLDQLNIRLIIFDQLTKQIDQWIN